MLPVVKTRLAMSLVLAALVVNPTYSQTLKEFFSSSDAPSFYFGIDFTKSKLIDDATVHTTDVRDKSYPGINETVVSETKKYHINGAFHKTNIDHDFGQVNQKNGTIDTNQIKSTNTADFHRLKAEDIADVVKGYDFGGRKGIGILFVVEALSKSSKAAAIWVTLTDMQSKKVLMTERMEASAKNGFTWKNYWSSAFKELLDDIEDSKYKEWQAKYQ